MENFRMNMGKFILILLAIIIFFQIPFLTKYDTAFAIVNIVITIAIWLIGTRHINKDTTLKKVIVYGFIVLWCGLIVLISYLMWGNFLSNFLITDATWTYSAIIIFIITRLISLKTIQDKIDKNPRKLIVIEGIFLIIGALIEYVIEYITNYISDLDLLYEIERVMYYINICIFFIFLFSTLKLDLTRKKDVIMPICISIFIIVLINLFPIFIIGKTISSQEELCNIINYKSDTLNYKNILTELEKYLPKEDIENLDMKQQIWDYQQYNMINENQLSVLKSWIEDINRKNFKEILETLQSYTTGNFQELINTGREICLYRIISMILSSIIIGGGSYFLLRKNSRYTEKF